VDKRYQIFISSTFKDLIEERQAILKAVLELDHMPAGMELFPASDDTAWRLIRDVIDASDYYIVVVGGRYGSLDEGGIGYTEKEYEYAFENDRPVIPLLHKDPGKLAREQTETDEAAWGKLMAFRAKLEGRHTCNYWANAGELKALAIVGLTAAMKRHPRIGWVRADTVPTGATIAEVLSLRNRTSELEAQLAATRLGPPPGAEDLHQGDDELTVRVSFSVRDPGTYTSKGYSAEHRVTWNEVFAAVAPTLIDEATDSMLTAAFDRFFLERVRETYKDSKDLKGKIWESATLSSKEREDFIIQYRALGLIRESNRPRSVRDTRLYWTLTPYGDNLMTRLRASRRTPLVAPEQPATVEVDTARSARRKRK
jgi:hypothetical protein